MTDRKISLLAGALALVSVFFPLGCTVLLGGGYTQDGPDGGVVHSGVDASADTTPAVEAQADACATAPTNKSQFEANLCGGQTCSAGDNSAVLASGYCAIDGGVLTCVVPVYAPPDGSVGAPPDASTQDGDVDAADSAPSALDASTADAATDDDAALDASTADAAPPPPPSTLPSCASIAGSNPIAANPSFFYPGGADAGAPAIYAIGSTAIEPYVGSIAQQYAAGVSTADGGVFGATIIYFGTGSCVGVEAAYSPPATPREAMTAAMQRGGVALVNSGGKKVYTGTYFDPTPPAPGQFPNSYSCALDPDDPAVADVGFSDVFPATCTTLPYPAPTDPLPNLAIADLFGPVQIMEMVVPTGSKAESITYEEAQLVWGYGGAAGIAPWTDSSFLFRRTSGSGTQTMIGAAIGLDPRVWQGVANSGSSNVVTDLENVINDGLPDGGAGSPESALSKTMGILSSDYTDDNALTLRPLAFQDQGESCAWLPDSSPGSFDKREVRDGHYPIWGPSHVIAPVQNGIVSNPTVNRLYAALNGQDPYLAAKLDVIELYATHHIVPTCAMHVTRASDGQSYGSYAPAGRTACSCYYDSVVPQDKPDAECTPCTKDSDCTDPLRVCNIFSGGSGFCEIAGQ